MNKYEAKPFVHWAGGKRQLIHDLDNMLPEDIHEMKGICYVEPFVGGGSMLFHLLQKYSNIRRAVIADKNEKLITCYRTIKSHPQKLIHSLMEIQHHYWSIDDMQTKEHFYMEKRKEFNQESLNDIETSTLFIFLNKTCFNGLYRVNSKGLFNTSFGKHTKPIICDEQVILADSALLQKVEILNTDFEDTLCYAGEDTLVYLDPPYRPISTTSSYTSYTSDKFDDNEQKRLKQYCDALTMKGAKWLLSNSDGKFPPPYWMM